MKAIVLEWKLIALALSQVVLLLLSGILVAVQWGMRGQFDAIHSEIHLVNVRLEDHMQATRHVAVMPAPVSAVPVVPFP